MTRIALVSDSTFDMAAGWSRWPRMHIIPIHIRFGETFYREGIDIDEATFYQRVDAEQSIPKTSQPNPSEFAELYRSLAADYDAVISMHVTAKLSGTYQSAVTAANMVKDEIAVYPFDTAAGSAASGFMADEAFDLIDAGASPQEVLARLETIRQRIHLFLTPDNLKYAVMSGRISAIGSVVASLLDIKPIIELIEGELIPGERVRTRKKAIKRMVAQVRQSVEDRPVRVAAVHAQAPEEAAKLLDEARRQLNAIQAITTTLATSVAVHLGPGTIGLVAYEP